jgi:phage baseplate assembly protein W
LEKLVKGKMVQNTSYNKNIFTKGAVTYKDFDFSFNPHPVSGDLRTKTDLEAVKQSVKNILLTNFGERGFTPIFGGGLNNLLFEPLDQIIRIELDKTIRAAIRNFEPRIDIIDLTIKEDVNNNSLEVTLKFNMINALDPQTINVILKRIR